MNHHYYASHAYGWSVSDTLEGVLERITANVPENMASKRFDSPLTVRVCRVLAPIDATYDIDQFWPVGVEIVDKTWYQFGGFVKGKALIIKSPNPIR